MAGSARSAATKHAYRMFAPSRSAAARGSTGGSADEFDECDVWGSFGPAGVVDCSGPGEIARARTVPSSARAAGGRKMPLDRAAVGSLPGSLPMSIPDWQKILGVEYRDHHAGPWELDGNDEDASHHGGMVPPHELAWRSRTASLSVHEGIGRTLKGRDLSRVRDAVWKRTGFED
ncbi:uncharacterized protein LOC124669431 [Lolium rigidum]|uniref:uncharacterized protein LOC124669431 n=1 Tax=Lolium rigidum TaxID=89674 RepID=UPI001F5CF7BF|nr:uncharacterized protein LOC124669431 [Lolium rigidum]